MAHWPTRHHRGSAINKTFIKNVHSHLWGGHSTSCKTNYLSGNFSLGGTLSTGMTVSDKKKLSFWKISENAPPCMTLESESKGGGFISFDRPWMWGELLLHTCRQPTEDFWGAIPEIDVWCTLALIIWENMTIDETSLSSCARRQQQNVFSVINVSHYDF